MAEPFSEWVRERPEEVQRLMIEWPPGARVRTKEGVRLMVPGPGVVGEVASWFENGDLGIVAPIMAAPPTHDGQIIPDGSTVRGACSPDQLEIVGYATFGDTELTPDVIREIVELR